MKIRHLLLLCLLGTTTTANTEPVERSAAAPARPAKLGLCSACHGERGLSSLPGHPHLAGQDQLYLRQSMEKYRTGERDSAPMRAALGALSTADLDALAEYYARQPRDGGQ